MMNLSRPLGEQDVVAVVGGNHCLTLNLQGDEVAVLFSFHHCQWQTQA